MRMKSCFSESKKSVRVRERESDRGESIGCEMH